MITSLFPPLYQPTNVHGRNQKMSLFVLPVILSIIKLKSTLSSHQHRKKVNLYRQRTNHKDEKKKQNKRKSHLIVLLLTKKAGKSLFIIFCPGLLMIFLII